MATFIKKLLLIKSLDKAVICSQKIVLGNRQKAKLKIDHIVHFYKEKDFKVTHYVNSNSYEFREESFLGRRNKKEFMVRVYCEDDMWCLYVEKPSYVFFFPILLALGLTIFFMVKLAIGEIDLRGALGAVCFVITSAFVIQHISGHSEVTSVSKHIQSILKEEHFV